MKKIILTNFWVVLTILSAWCKAEAEEDYLTGISILGEDKVAYLSFQGETIAVQEGDKLGHWQVIRIEKESVKFQSEDGITTELRLKTKAPLATTPSTETEPSKTSPPTTTETEQPPAGYRTVQTPFGTFTVTEEEPMVQATPPTLPPIPPTPAPINLTDKPATQAASTDKPVTQAPVTSLPQNPEPLTTAIPKTIEITEKNTPITTTIPKEVEPTEENIPSYRVVKTPFGDFVVEEETQLSAQNPSPLPSPATEQAK